MKILKIIALIVIIICSIILIQPTPLDKYRIIILIILIASSIYFGRGDENKWEDKTGGGEQSPSFSNTEKTGFTTFDRQNEK